jgi:tetratricopeptide (TPR) repeat protein
MHLRQKTLRRLLILGGVIAVAAIAFGIALWINTRKFEQKTAQARVNAMAAYAKGDYASALPYFSEYLSSSKTADKAPGEADVEALLAYGKSRQAIPMPKGRHLTEAMRIYERYLQLKPGDREAQHLLLELYPKVKYNEEALNLARKVLETDPKDVPALRAKVIALANQRNYKDALAVAEDLLRLIPNDLETHRNVQSLMVMMGNKPGEDSVATEKVVARYEALAKQHPDDPRFELMLARAYLFANNRERATFWLKSAAARHSTDPEFAAVLTSLLDRYDLFSESNEVLERLASVQNDAIHVRPLVRRMWYAHDDKSVLKRTDDQDPASPQSDTDLLAYRAMALYDLNRPTDAEPIVDALANRKDDMAAVAWATALRARATENLPPRERVKQYLAALERSPDNEAVHFFLGDAYAALGESEPALDAWRDAAQLAPSWAAPASAIARMLAATGRSAEALSASLEALRRAPKALGTVTGYIVAKFTEQQQNPDPAEQKRLLGTVEKVQAQVPREPETLHIYAALLSRTGQRDKAVEVIKSAIAPDAATPRDTLLALASVSFAEKLGLEGEILDCAERLHGVTPPIAIRKAVLLSQAGKTKDGLELLQDSRKRDTKSDPTQWDLAVLQYRENTGDTNLLSEWVRLGDANPDNALVQSAILRSPSRLKDKIFWLRTIERLKKLTGDEAVTPRLERARWLLAGDTTESQATDAIVLLKAMERIELPEIHRLLGLAHEKNAAHATGANRDSLLRIAVDELQKAFVARNADPAVATDYARVLRAVGRNTDADHVLSDMADHAPNMGLEGRKRTARTLIVQGQLAKAIEVLEPVGDGQDVSRDALLANLYRRTGQGDKSAAMYRKLLADDRAEAIAIAEGADYFASRGDADTAGAFLARLRSIDVPAATRELLFAAYYQRHGTSQQSLASFENAVAADPARPATWLGLVAHHLRRLEFAKAVAAADRGLKAIPDEPNLKALRARAVALEPYKQDASLQTLAEDLASDPQNGAITEMVRILSEARGSGAPLLVTVGKLRELADRNPDASHLQMYVAQAYARSGQFDEAERIAQRAAERSPNDTEAARLLTMIYAARPGAEKWPKVLDAARQWRRRSLDDPTAADLSIAGTLIEMRRYNDAASQLQSYIPKEPKPGTANPAVLSVYAQAVVRAGDPKRASDLLLPLAKSSSAWRKLWLGVAPLAFDNAAGASAWIEQIAPLVPPDAPAEQVALADAWCAVGVKFSSDAEIQKAKAIAQPLANDPKTAAEGWRLMAMVSEQSGDMDGASHAWRRMLKLKPNDSNLQNNLAYALLHSDKPEDLAEARKLIEAALAKSPNNSTYLDTLARVHLKAKDLPAAEHAFQRALDAESTSVEAMIGLADVHAQAGRIDKARDLLVRINNALQASGNSALPAGLRRQLESVRQSVKPPVQSGRID